MGDVPALLLRAADGDRGGVYVALPVRSKAAHVSQTQKRKENLMKVRTTMTFGHRVKMFLGSVAAIIGGLAVAGNTSSDAAITLAACAILLGIAGIIGSFIGLQDHSL